MEPNLTIEIVKNDSTPAKVMDLGVQEGLLTSDLCSSQRRLQNEC
jgi:hypothetical protein